MNNYQKRASKREWGVMRKQKNFRLHPQTMKDMITLAKFKGISQARLIEELVEKELIRSIYDLDRATLEGRL